jgi:3-phenylpropionate/trans-cinnamate dioxygenase ferredoxin reductase component
MTHYKYLIIGGGMTADEAARAIRAADRTGSLGMISAEANPPYDRPPLTKDLWKGMPEEKVWRGTDTLGVDLHLGRQAQVLDATRKRVADDQGDVYTYEKLLLATGGRPRHLPFDHDPSDVVYYRTLKDYRRLVQMTERKQRFAVVGGGFIGSEIAAALAMNGQDMVMIFPEQGVGGLFFPTDLAQFLNQYYRDRGVEVRNGRLVEGLAKQDGQTVLKLDDQSTVAVDGVIAGLGIQPNTELAEFAGLKIDDGIVVDQFLRTSEADIFAAGDVALFPDPLLGVRRRVEHEDNAINMGQLAGRAMAGDPVPYDHSPYFYSDLFDLGYEAVGELNSQLETVSDWQQEYEKGVVYYLKDGRVRGVLLWHVWDQVDAARELMAEPVPGAAADLMGRLPAS